MTYSIINFITVIVVAIIIIVCINKTETVIVIIFIVLLHRVVVLGTQALLGLASALCLLILNHLVLFPLLITEVVSFLIIVIHLILRGHIFLLTFLVFLISQIVSVTLFVLIYLNLLLRSLLKSLSLLLLKQIKHPDNGLDYWQQERGHILGHHLGIQRASQPNNVDLLLIGVQISF